MDLTREEVEGMLDAVCCETCTWETGAVIQCSLCDNHSRWKRPPADKPDDLPRLARSWLEMEARCERLRELGMSAGVLGDAMTNDQWVAAWARHREAMRACESHGDLEE